MHTPLLDFSARAVLNVPSGVSFAFCPPPMCGAPQRGPWLRQGVRRRQRSRHLQLHARGRGWRRQRTTPRQYLDHAAGSSNFSRTPSIDQGRETPLDAEQLSPPRPAGCFARRKHPAVAPPRQGPFHADSARKRPFEPQTPNSPLYHPQTGRDGQPGRTTVCSAIVDGVSGGRRNGVPPRQEYPHIFRHCSRAL